jgi:hypothetical protein
MAVGARAHLFLDLIEFANFTIHRGDLGPLLQQKLTGSADTSGLRSPFTNQHRRPEAPSTPLLVGEFNVGIFQLIRIPPANYPSSQHR